MSLAGDKLYNGYLRRKMPAIVSKVKVRDILPHLSCLTADDRESIEAKREVCGNYDGMVLLLDCLKKTENWPEQFIDALQTCGHTTIAAEVRAEYSAVKGTDGTSPDPDPSSPPTTVVRAHVHPAPPASPVSLPQAPSPSPAASQAIPALEITVQPQPSAQNAEAPESVPSSELPHPTLMEAPPLPSTPPPSPDTPHNEVAVAPLSQKEINSLLGENLESGQQPSDPKEDGPPQSPASPASPAQTKSDVTDGSSFIALSSEKPSVQDAAPPAAPTAESRPQTEAEPGAAGVDDSVCQNKPEQLTSVQPQSRTSPTVPAPSSPVDSSSGYSDTSQATATKTVTAVSCQENGFTRSLNKPEGNHYETKPREKQGTQEPSIPKPDVQTSAPQAQIVNGEVAKETASAPPPSSLNAAPAETETPLLQSSEETALLQTPLSPLANRKYMMTAAVGVGACAMLMAWKMKN